MKKKEINMLCVSICLLVAFIIWTIIIQIVDVSCVGPRDSSVGLSTVNVWFHNFTGVHMIIYTITDWLGLIPLLICLAFGILGLIQLIKRKSLLKVDLDIIILGIYYILVIGAYLLFEMIPINYRPVLIDGFLEASYPSSTTLLVLSVMPTLVFQVKRRLENYYLQKILCCFSYIFSAFMVLGRTVAGVHWLTDIIGSILLSSSLFLFYKTTVIITCKE